MLVCITGFSGVGKTTIIKELKQDYQVAILDELVHEQYQFNHLGYQIIKNHFGYEYVNDKEVDRKKLGQLVFNNAEQMEQLNKLLEPLISGIIKELKMKAKNNLILVEAAALLTNYERYAHFFDQIILIQAPVDRVFENNKNKFFYLDKFENFAWNLNKEMKFDLIVNNDSLPNIAVIEIRKYLAKILTKK